MSEFELDCQVIRNAAATFIDSMAANGALSPWAGALPNAMTTAEVMSARRKSPVSFRKWSEEHAVKYLCQTQLVSGNWTDDNSDDPWDVSSTAWAVHALKGVDSRDAADARERGLVWLELQVLPGGGLPTNARHTQPNTYATAYGIRALRDRSSVKLGHVARFLLESQNEDGGWGLRIGDTSESTLSAYALHGLLSAPPALRAHAVDKATKFLHASRRHNGTWGSWLSEIESVEGTAFCTYVLQLCNAITETELEQSIRYIAGRVKDGSVFNIEGVPQVWVAISTLLVTAGDTRTK